MRASSEETAVRSDCAGFSGAGSAITQDDVRASSSGRRDARASSGTAGAARGRTHADLRRVPDDGRHLGSSRATSFHEAVVTLTLAASSHGNRSAKAHQHIPWHEEVATGVSEARSHRAPQEENACAVFDRRSAEADPEAVKPPIPW